MGQSTDWFAVTISVGAELVTVCDMFADGKVDAADFKAFVKPIARLGLIAREHVAATAPREFDRAQEQRKAEKLVQRCLDDPDTTE